MAEPRELTVQPIGRVVSGRRKTDPDDLWETEVAEIEVDPVWAGALDGLEGFSHVWLLWWLDRFEHPPETVHVRPEGRPEMPLTGIFATRSPHRPNPLALTAVRLVERQGARLRVQGLDAYEGTLIVDIKPYMRRGDLIAEATVPAWLEQLWRVHDREREA
jgi:tRNA-Thr(GGU) m(6)t(6)A37 methyltransferase TsaA